MADNANVTEKPFRAGVFSSRQQAEHAVKLLLAAGFTKDQVSVLCSDEALQRDLEEFDAPHPTPKDAADAAITGSVFGGLLGGLASVALTTAAGMSVLVIGPGIFGGAIAGSLVGAMTTRGVEKEIADFYDQAVTEGQLLVAVEYHGPNPEEALGRAEQVFREAGAQPLPLTEG